MRIAHFILVHKDPALVERLIKRLQHPNSDFYIHIDKKADAAAFRQIGKLPNIRFIRQRIDVIWGGYNLLKAMLVCMQEILETGVAYDFLNHLSGQDYPLHSPEFIDAYFEKQIGKSFICGQNPKEDPEFEQTYDQNYALAYDQLPVPWKVLARAIDEPVSARKKISSSYYLVWQFRISDHQYCMCCIYARFSAPTSRSGKVCKIYVGF